jgi:plasmid stability protein
LQALHTLLAKESTMETLTLRGVDPDLKKRLRIRAARNGRSMEAELRAILKDVLGAETEIREPNLADEIRSYFAPFGGVELEPHPPTPVRPPPKFR